MTPAALRLHPKVQAFIESWVPQAKEKGRNLMDRDRIAYEFLKVNGPVLTTLMLRRQITIGMDQRYQRWNNRHRNGVNTTWIITGVV